MSDSENIYSLPLDSENQTRAKSSAGTKTSDEGFPKNETEDEDIPRLEVLHEQYSQEQYIQLVNSFHFNKTNTYISFMLNNYSFSQ